MKKLALLVGTLGGAVAGYVFSNPKLRDQLRNAKDPEEAGKIFADHVKKDGRKIGKEVQGLAASDEVQRNVTQAKKFLSDHTKSLKEEFLSYFDAGEEAVVNAAEKAKKTVHRAAGKASRAVKKKTTKAAKTTKKTATKASKTTNKAATKAAKKTKKTARKTTAKAKKFVERKV